MSVERDQRQLRAGIKAITDFLKRRSQNLRLARTCTPAPLTLEKLPRAREVVRGKIEQRLSNSWVTNPERIHSVVLTITDGRPLFIDKKVTTKPSEFRERERLLWARVERQALAEQFLGPLIELLEKNGCPPRFTLSAGSFGSIKARINGKAAQELAKLKAVEKIAFSPREKSFAGATIAGYF